MTTTWLSERRAEARAIYERTPLPTLREENWRYTSLRGIDFDAFRAPGAGDGAPAVPRLLPADELGGRFVQRGASVVETSLDPSLADAGVTFGSLEDLAESRPD